MIVAGIGFRRGATLEDLDAVLRSAQAAFGVRDEDIAAIATADVKADEPGVIALAARRGLPLRAFTKADLAAVAGVLSPSARVQRLIGVASVSEAAALLAAGRNARLLGRRIANAAVTCALASGDGVAGGEQEERT